MNIATIIITKLKCAAALFGVSNGRAFLKQTHFASKDFFLA